MCFLSDVQLKEGAQSFQSQHAYLNNFEVGFMKHCIAGPHCNVTLTDRPMRHSLQGMQ